MPFVRVRLVDRFGNDVVDRFGNQLLTRHSIFLPDPITPVEPPVEEPTPQEIVTSEFSIYPRSRRYERLRSWKLPVYLRKIR